MTAQLAGDESGASTWMRPAMSMLPSENRRDGTAAT